MPAFLYFLIALLAIKEKTTAVSYYVVTSSHNTDVAGCYQDSGHTTNINGGKRPIFKGGCPRRYLLQLESNGNWAIAEDILGQNVMVEQVESNYPWTPDTAAWSWVFMGAGEEVCEGQGFNQEECEAIACCEWDAQKCWSGVGNDPCSSFASVNIRGGMGECMNEECLMDDNDRDNDVAEDNDEKRNPAVLVYAVCGVLGGIILTLCMVFIAHCVYIKKKEASKEVTVDANPEYGKEYEYDYQHVWDEGISGIVDQNEYYNS